MADKKEKKETPVQKVLRDLKAEREASGLTLSDAQIAFIVKVCKACAG